MKLVWSPERARKAYIDTLEMCKNDKESDNVEMISAMAGGWNPSLIVEAWSSGSEILTSIGLDIAARHLGARYVCIVQNECAGSKYVTAMKDHGSRVPEMMVGEPKEVMARLPEVEFMVADGRPKELHELFGLVKLSPRGAVLMCKNAMQSYMDGFLWDLVFDKKVRLMRSVIIPVGQGLNIAYVKGNRASKRSPSKERSRWITRIDHKTGEEHIFRG